MRRGGGGRGGGKERVVRVGVGGEGRTNREDKESGKGKGLLGYMALDGAQDKARTECGSPAPPPSCCRASSG